MDVDLSHGPSYGHTLTWSAPLKPSTDVQLVHAQVDVNLPTFTKMFVDRMSARALAALSGQLSRDSPWLKCEPLFWFEAAAVVAFGVSWLTKGEAFLKD